MNDNESFYHFVKRTFHNFFLYVMTLTIFMLTAVALAHIGMIVYHEVYHPYKPVLNKIIQ